VIIPAIPGRKEQIYNLGAYTMAFTILPLILTIGFADVAWFVRAFAFITAAYMVVAAILFLFVKRAHAYYLYFQVTYIALFHLVILLATYSFMNCSASGSSFHGC
jgi:hypothetical protein